MDRRISWALAPGLAGHFVDIGKWRKKIPAPERGAVGREEESVFTSFDAVTGDPVHGV
jgi:hypothetical protein